ncbi:MAG: 50S ribosomal protein L4 [Chloroflexota bacterium]|nr:50S ribosomal protein L4 [Chloroflexota bacterium]
MKLSVHNAAGKELEAIEVDDAVFGIEPNIPVVHQAFVTAMANRRMGNANTKTRGEVSFSTKKIRSQKGTGASRQGSIGAPQHRHGGIAFGPRPRSYAKDLPKKMRRLAIRSVLSGKAADGSLRVVQDLGVSKPSTKAMSGLLKALGFERTVLVVTGASDANVKASASNLEHVNLVPASHLNVADMLSSQGLLMTVDAVRGAEALWGGARAATKRGAKVEA